MNYPVWGRLAPPIPTARMPRHVAIIMDGNGRWARRQGFQRIRGHEAGAEAVRGIVRYASQVGIEALTLYAFSTENWKRPRLEVRFLMELLQKYLKRETPELKHNQVRFSTIGEIFALPARARDCIQTSQTAMSANKGLNLCLALNYGAQAELLDTARGICRDAAENRLDPSSVALETITARLHTRSMPPVDILIRTAGERRISNFLLWQSVGAHFHCAAPCWPEFTPSHLEAALQEYGAAELTPH